MTTDRRRRRAARDVFLCVALLSVWIAVSDWIALSIPWLSSYGGALSALGFLALPFLWPSPGVDPLGMTDPSLWRSAKSAGVCLLLILAPFLVGYDLLARHIRNQSRFSGPGLLSPGLVFQGEPSTTDGHLAIFERGRSIMVVNGLSRTVSLIDSDQRPLVIKPGRRIELKRAEQRLVELRDAAGPLATSDISLGASGAHPDTPKVDLRPGWGWILWLICTQLVMIAIPEEAFFRGWLLQRLRSAWSPNKTVFGSPFGLPHVISAALFASVHLILTPAPHRLLVFFPGLLFAWLAERNGGILGAAVVHAGCNVMLLLATRMYA